MLKLISVVLASAFLSGCFLRVEVGEGGSVQSLSDTRNCAENTSCSFEVTDTDFVDTFTAIPKAGYVFSHWKGGDGYLCPNLGSPVCMQSNTHLAGNPSADAFIASDSEMILEPVFISTTEIYLDAIRDTNAVIVDATGSVIGIPADTADALGRTFYARVDGVRSANLLRLRIATGGAPVLDSTEIVYFTSSFCGGDAYMAVTEEQQIGEYWAGLSYNSIHIIDRDADPELLPFLSYSSGNGICKGSSIAPLDALPAPAFPFDVQFPVEYELR
jgi:Divergent InlB B-repeat domain